MISARMRGYKAKKNGDKFEQRLVRSAFLAGWKHIQIPMGARMLSATQMVRTKTPFDFILHKKNMILFADAKTTSAKTFSHSMISEHQARHLSNLHKNGFMAGYVIFFQALNATVFISGTQLIEIQKGQSFTSEHGILIGNEEFMDFDKLFELN